jgi:hypothetical protein
MPAPGRLSVNKLVYLALNVCACAFTDTRTGAVLLCLCEITRSSLIVQHVISPGMCPTVFPHPNCNLWDSSVCEGKTESS